jgi:hypothetical protein
MIAYCPEPRTSDAIFDYEKYILRKNYSVRRVRDRRAGKDQLVLCDYSEGVNRTLCLLCGPLCAGSRHNEKRPAAMSAMSFQCATRILYLMTQVQPWALKTVERLRPLCRRASAA